jgi:hypothetical protein
MQVYPRTSNANSDSHAGLAKCAKKTGSQKFPHRKLPATGILTAAAVTAADRYLTTQYSHAEPPGPDDSKDNDTNS